MTSEAAGQRISSVMAVYNGATYVEAAIESLVAQSRTPFEIIVIDDGSTDDSGALAVAAGRGRVRLITQAHRGGAAARNAGRSVALGDLIHFFDADDLMSAGSLEAMADALAANPDWEAVFGRWRNFWIEALAHEQALPGNEHLVGDQPGLLLTSGLYRRTLLDRLPEFAEGDRLHGDAHWMGVFMRGDARIGRIDRNVVERRIHYTNQSRRKSLDGMLELALKIHRASRDAGKEKLKGEGSSSLER